MCKLLSLVLLFLPSAATADSRLLYLEAQAVAGYSSRADDIIYHSAGRDDMMQKTSGGVDYLQKFSSENGDWGTLAIESRLAWDPDARARLQPQLYNGYFRTRTPYGYLWAGHNRIAMGLESYFDTHAALMQTLQMYGAGFDRDWGAGASKDFDWGDAAFSLTAGSGMPLYLHGNYLASARLSEGVLARDNYNTGLYFSGGKIPDITGYHIENRTPETYNVAGTDFAYLLDRFEFRGDLRFGQKDGKGLYAALGRFGVNFLEENRLKLELQTVLTETNNIHDYFLTSGLAYAATPELSLRAIFEYENLGADKRLMTQVYYYLKI
ncbi:MAG: hypothetical protein WCW52_07520 [Elusimicrobiales bacterium]|jgi:hypothetical protein